MKLQLDYKFSTIMNFPTVYVVALQRLLIYSLTLQNPFFT